MLSVLCANAYPGFSQIAFLLSNLSEQTCQDFETILLDMHYAANKQAVAEICNKLKINNVIHVPACEARDVGRLMHWELHNNSLLLARGEWVLHHGIRRYMHRDTISAVTVNLESGVCSVLNQNTVDEPGLEMFRPELIEKTYTMHVASFSVDYLSQSGFFSAPRKYMIEELNGHNEALVIHHWIDNDLSARAKHTNLRVKILPRALLRKAKYVPADALQAYEDIKVGKPVCTKEENPYCVWHLLDLKTYRRIEHPVERIIYDDFEWVRCPKCGTICVENPEEYMKHLENPAYIKAPINLAGIGRNLSRLAADMSTLSLRDKVELLQNSHTNPRYLEK